MLVAIHHVVIGDAKVGEPFAPATLQPGFDVRSEVGDNFGHREQLQADPFPIVARIVAVSYTAPPHHKRIEPVGNHTIKGDV